MTYTVQVSENQVVSTSARMQQSVKTLNTNNIKFGFKMEMRAEYTGVNTGNITLSGEISSVHAFMIVPTTSSPQKLIALKGIVDNTDNGLSSFDIREKYFSFRIIDKEQTEIAHWGNLTSREDFTISIETQKEYYLESEMRMELLWQTNPFDAVAETEIFFLEIIEP